jgi:hypothetical protein
MDDSMNFFSFHLMIYHDRICLRAFEEGRNSIANEFDLSFREPWIKGKTNDCGRKFFGMRQSSSVVSESKKWALMKG